MYDMAELSASFAEDGWNSILQDSLPHEGTNVLELSCHDPGKKQLSLLDLYVAIIPY